MTKAYLPSVAGGFVYGFSAYLTTPSPPGIWT